MYPTPPGPRIAYDKDGTEVYAFGSLNDFVMQAHEAFVRGMNSDDNVTGRAPFPRNGLEGNAVLSTTGIRLALRFPEPTHIRAIALACNIGLYSAPGGGNTAGWTVQCVIETSSDSTNGLDGTWSTLAVSEGHDFDNLIGNFATEGYSLEAGAFGTVLYAGVPMVVPNFRKSVSESGFGWSPVLGGATRQVTWLRISPGTLTRIVGNGVVNDAHIPGFTWKLHLYGEPDTAATDDRLVFTTATGEDKLFDWGDLGQGTTLTQTFKVKNISADMTADGILVSILSPNPDIALDPEQWLRLSLDGVLWTSNVTLPALAPGESSDTITLRVQVGNTLVGPSGPRLTAEVEEWI